MLGGAAMAGAVHAAGTDGIPVAVQVVPAQVAQAVMAQAVMAQAVTAQVVTAQVVTAIIDGLHSGVFQHSEWQRQARASGYAAITSLNQFPLRLR
jgi:hypothetical protein